jgi:GTP cyclohydrolase I
MTKKIKLTNANVDRMADHLANLIRAEFPHEVVPIYGIPRGGVPVAYLLARYQNIRVVDDPADAALFVDDIIDSGTTLEHWCDTYPGTPFFALIDKRNPHSPCNSEEALDFIRSGGWIEFPWEAGNERAEDDSIVGTILNRIKHAGVGYYANDNISAFIHSGELEELQNEVQHRAEHFLRGLIIDVDNDHNTRGTAKRIAKMYLHEVFKGRYKEAPHITDFPNAKKLDEMYMTGPITIRSACSHHFVPIIGRCWIGLIPGDRVIGLSKFNRIVDWIASRPQIQEELVVQIADFIEEQIAPVGLAVVVEATHMCMTWRGVKEPLESKMTTNVMRGAFRDSPEARSEFMALVAK